MTIKVKLREKSISKGRKSLYLDFYPPIAHPETGEPTRREFLGLYVSEQAKNPFDKLQDKETRSLAEQIRHKRENELNKSEIYNEFEKDLLKTKELGKQNFVDYYKTLANKRKGSNHDNWMSALIFLENFTNGKLLFSELNESVLEEFKTYLLTTKSNKSSKTTLAHNSAVSYFNKIKASLKQAYKDGILKTDLNSKVKPIPQAETRREYLTLDELNVLVKTPCNNKLLRRAALFSALTGLRFSDIQKMTWDELEYIDGQGYVLHFKQQKTKGIETQPIPEQAVELMGTKGEPSATVFEGLTYSAYHNKHLFQWIGAAGITKDITFHCFRHTYATLQLYNGTDITTVSKMLGHKDLKTTQIYAKIVDDAKRQTTDKIKLTF